MYLTTIFYTNEPATCHNNRLQSLIYDGDKAVDWKQAKKLDRGFLSYQYDEVAGGEQEGG